VSKIISKENYVDDAEKAINSLRKDDRNGQFYITTSKIRNLMSMSADIYNSVIAGTEDELTEDDKSRIDYLRVRILYEAGRDRDVKDFVLKTKINDILKEMDKTKEDYILFYRYMEALVAYHKYYGGRDK
jgi:CRISPR-associated protein Csm2